MKVTMVRVSPRLRALWREAAAREELSRAAFLRLALQERARRVLGQNMVTQGERERRAEK